MNPANRKIKMKTVKCNFKNADNYQANFKDSQCLLLISVGQEAHEEERFAATIDLINDSFKFCFISLYDTLQRHTMSLNRMLDPESFHGIAEKEGKLWMERNKQYYDKLRIPKKILRWDMWLNHNNYKSEKSKLMNLMQKDPSYKLAFDITIEKYLERYCKNLNEKTEFNMDRAKKICFDYILEECTVLCLWPELKCEFEIYPNAHNDAIEETRKRFIYTQYENMLQPLTLRFRNAKQLRPQKFNSLVEEEWTV